MVDWGMVMGWLCVGRRIYLWRLELLHERTRRLCSSLHIMTKLDEKKKRERG